MIFHSNLLFLLKNPSNSWQYRFILTYLQPVNLWWRRDSILLFFLGHKFTQHMCLKHINTLESLRSLELLLHRFVQLDLRRHVLTFVVHRLPPLRRLTLLSESTLIFIQHFLAFEFINAFLNDLWNGQIRWVSAAHGLVLVQFERLAEEPAVIVVGLHELVSLIIHSQMLISFLSNLIA